MYYTMRISRMCYISRKRIRSVHDHSFYYLDFS